MSKIGEIKKNHKTRAILEWSMALVLALLIANFLCFFYIRDVAGIEREGGAVYAASQPGIVSVNCEEGYGRNKIDENGYVNATSNLAEDGYILILGNSMTREVNVMPEDRYVQQLNAMLASGCGGDANNTAYVYSISRGGALFAELASGYDAALAEFPNAKSVVIQLVFSNRDIELSQEYLEQVYNQRFFDETQTANYIFENEDGMKRFKHWVKNSFPIIPFAQNRRFNKLGTSFSGAFGFEKFLKNENSVITNAEIYENNNDSDDADFNLNKAKSEALTDVLNYLNSKNDIPLIIIDIPEIAYFNESKIEYNLHDQDIWKSACDETGVTFLGMTDEFQKLYSTEKKLPYGFTNTSLGTGHLNKDGNRVVAETLYKTLHELEVIE